MATYDLQEQEQLDALKAWWKQHGNLLINVVTAIAIAFAAWQGWKWYQNRQAEKASVVFSLLKQAVQENNTQGIKAFGGELLNRHPRTIHASLGALASARMMIESEDVRTAKIQLLWVANNGRKEIRPLARLRLAALLLDEKDYEGALKHLEGKAPSGFEMRFANTRGDILLAMGKKTEAANAYREALASASRPSQSNAIYREVITQKYDALGRSN